MSSQIIGNTEYNSIKEKAYINGTQENIMRLAKELDKVGINYSGRVSNYRSAITVEAADRARTLEILKGILNEAKKNAPAENTEKNIIGNAEYRYIPNKRYVRGETEAMLRTADRLAAENISFSGRINGDIVTLTVSGDDVQELAKKYFAEEKNRIENIQSAYFLALSSDTFEDGYYISEVNATTGEEIAPYRSKFGDISMFISVDSAVTYAEVVGVTLSNSNEQLNEWRRIEDEAEKEKDRQLNLSRSREIKKRLPISENGYEELFVLRDDSIDWIYFNPDGADGEGQFVVTSLYADDVLNAYVARTSTDVHNSQSAFIETIENGRQTVINADTEEFERYALSYITSRNKDNVIVSAPIASGNGYNDNFQNIINTLESFFDEVHSYKENHITHESDNISIEGHIGTWYVIDSEEIEGKKLFLLEHEEYGDSAASIIVDENKNLVMEDVWNGFDDYRDSLEFDDGKQHISNDMAVDMWGHGFPIYINDRDTLMIDTPENAYELFRNDNNDFYAAYEYVAQERYLSNTVTGLDKLNDIAISEASLTGTTIDTIADYAKDMYEDGETAYKWSDGLTEWENLAASILSGDTEYIHRWIEDLLFALPNLEDNSGFSIEAFYSNLVNYEKQYGRISEEEMKVGTQFVYDNANWEVVLVNSNVLSLKKLESENGMDSLIIEDWQNTVKRSEIEFIEENPLMENIPLSEQLVNITDKISHKQKEITAFVVDNDFTNAAVAAQELAELSREAENIKEQIQAQEITADDVNVLRKIKPARKSVQNMLDNEVAQTPKFEKLLNEEMGEKSAFEMRISDNEWRNDESKTVPIINIQKRDIPENITELQKSESIKNITRGTFVNRDTGIEIQFGRRSVEEIIAKAIPDNKRDIPVEARMAAIYQMQDLIENAICFDSQISEYNEDNSKNKSPNTLFIHRMYSILDYNNEKYLANLSVEEFYSTDKENRFRDTNNRLYAFRDIKITPVKLLGGQAHADLQNTSQDTSSSVIKISIPQLYEIVKIYDQSFFENPNAEGRADRETEIETQEQFSKAMEILAEKGKDSELNIAAEKNYEFTVVTFEDGSEYVLAGTIDDNNINGTSAYEDMVKNNFDRNNIVDLEDNIKVTYTVYHTGNGEPVYPTYEELSEIKNNIESFKENTEPYSVEESYLHPWKDVDEVLYDLNELWTKRHDSEPNVSDDFDREFALLPEHLSPTARSNGINYYDTLMSVQKIKLSGSDWLDTVDAVVEMNRRGVNLDEVEMLQVNTFIINATSKVISKELTPEQFAVYEKRISNDTAAYDEAISHYKTRKKKDDKGLKYAQDNLENNLAVIVSKMVASDELEDISEKIFTDSEEKKIDIAKQYVSNIGVSVSYFDEFGLNSTDVKTYTSEENVRFELSNGFSISYSWADIAAAFEQAALNDMERYYTSGHVSELYRQTLEKETAAGSDLDVQLERSVFTEWVTNKIIDLKKVKEAYESNDKALFENTVRREVDGYFYMLCDKDESIEGYNLKDISDFVHDFSTNENLRKEIYATVTENVDISRGLVEKAREAAHNAGLPFREVPAGEDIEDFNPYVFDGTMSSEDYELMHKLMREDNFEIYQVKDGDEYRDKRFTAFSELNGKPNVSDYNLVYSGKLSELNIAAGNSNDILENIFSKFNIERPEDFKGYSLSISDVIMLHRNSEDTAHYVDTTGYVDIPEFIKERDLAPIDKQPEKENTPVENNVTEQSNIQFGLLGNGITCYDISKMDRENNDYLTVAHISEEGIVRYYVDDLSESDKKQIDSHAAMQKKKFTEEWDKLPHQRKYVIISDKIHSTGTVEQIRFFDSDHLPTIADKVKKYERSVIFKDEGFPTERTHNDHMDKAMALINEFYEKRFNLKANFSNLYHIDLAYTIDENTEIPIEVYANLVTFCLVKEYDGKVIEEETFSSLEEMCGRLGNMEFDELVAIDNPVAELSKETPLKNVAFENPEETIEQISFLSNTPKRTSVDEIGYYSSADESPQIENSPLGNPQENTAEKKKTADFTITDGNYGSEGGAKTRFRNNIEAIKLLKAIESENRLATPDEQKILAKYVGWGGIPQAFDSSKTDWNNEYTELKNLLSDNEYAAARASTLNAHYTTPTVINAIYSALDNMGFSGGKIIEPAMGIGNFFGAMPENMRNNSDLYGVELDSITGRIAQQLYQSANIQITGYEKTGFANNSYDVAVGNVPFGSYKVNDKDYNKQNMFIHDYFFSKTLDKVRPGGIVAFVTSKGTLDKENPDVRKYLAERAELLGAIRLPNNAFRANAGTEVTSDIIFLQKREHPISIEENPPEWVYKDMLDNGIAVNKYFADHPEMILGEMVEGNKLYGNQTDASMCIPIDGADLKEQLAAAIKNITGTYKEAEKEKTVHEASNDIPCPPDSAKFSFIVQDDILYYRKAVSTMTKVEASENNINRIKAMVQLRDNVHNLLELQLNNVNGTLEADIISAQKELNSQYDNFSEKYGLISSNENKKLFSDDSSYHLIKSLEKLDSDGKFIGKADIFSKKTVNPKIIVDHCDNANDALILSLSEKMCVNLEYMSILTGKTEEELISELGDKIFQNPQKDMRWESADEYLTGNIRAKLAVAEAAGMERNVEALRAVIPQRIEAADIAIKLGSAWVDPQYIRQFIIETLKPDFFTEKAINVTYSEATDKWKVEGWQKGYNNTLSTETYGTADMNAYQIIEATLNMKKAEIRERVKDERGNYIRDDKGKYVLQTNQEKTMIVQAKQDELKRKFQDWIFADPDRREKLVTLYNEKFNSTRLREYDGSNLHFVGMNSAITLSEHQKNAVARDLYSNGNTLLAHEVGAGKTYEMVSIAMEGKRLGLHSKSLITAPNALTEQWGEAFRTLYPNANVLVATEKDFKTENRRDLFAKIATGDWDAVIIGHSQFDMIHLSKDRELKVLYSEVEKLEAALNEMTDGNGKRSFSVKQVEKAIKSYENKIETLLSKTPEDDMLCFEKLGVDKIFVDESQNYKNLDTPSKMQNVAGLGSGGAGKSMQLLMKCKYIDEITDGKGIVFASGTPISNSMAEMYTLMRYLQADKLQELGINSFDQWASVFGETTTSMELSPEGNGKYQSKTRFAKFQNLPELMNIFKECADIKTAASLNLDRPDFEMHNVNVPATSIQAQMIKSLGERAKAIRSGEVEPTEDNMCKLTVDGRKIGLDQRCMNPDLPDDPNSKVNVCINNVFDIWQRTAEQKSTQLIFCDLATPKPHLNENSYNLYRRDTDGRYNSVYTAKLGKKDNAEKILKRFNSNKPPKNFKAGGAYDGDIIVLQNVNYDDGMAYSRAFIVDNGNLKELSIGEKAWEQLPVSPAEPFDSQRRFCVYDDIKQKLVEKGVPEKEIAFIHEADKAEDKLKLFDKMNKGEVRIMVGSTERCGAGMNAQQRMIALHDLDAPMRPSDMEQRHGRIIRQGNENSKVDIYRYTTDKTFDAYLYQMLENKQKFISQIMTDKSPVRSCEDVDEIALDYAEVKALCAGNPLIKEKIDLETDITKLNVLKSSFLSQKYSLQDKAYKTLPERQRTAELYIHALQVEIDSVNRIQPLTDEDGKNYYPVTVNGTEYHDKEQAGEAIRQAILKSGDILEGKERTIGSYRGFAMSAFLDNLNKVVKVNLKGAVNHYGEINMNKDVKASGNIIRLDNIINGIEPELTRQEERLQSIKADIEEAKIAAEAVFPQEQELNAKETRLAEVNALLSSSDVTSKNNGQELYAALVEICPELENYYDVYCKYEVGKDSGIEPLCVEKHGDIVLIAHTYVQNGDLMNDPAIQFEFDTDTKSAKAISYEMSSIGIYTNFSGENAFEERDDVESLFLDTMLENIKAYNYERTKINVSNHDKPEKEIITDNAR